MILSKLARLSSRLSFARGVHTSAILRDGNYRWKAQFQRLIGNREQVGYGCNGQPWYHDSPVFPFPAIRYKEPTPEIKALREKERGDWKELSIEDKKNLYRASFCRTFSEFMAPTGWWKEAIGICLVLVALGLWLQIVMTLTVYNQLPMPMSYCDEWFRAQTRRQIDLHMNPVQGIGSEWDYDKGDWKEPHKFGQLPNPFIDPCTGERIVPDYRA